MSDGMVILGFGAAHGGETFAAAADRVYPLSPEQRSRREQLMVTYAMLMDLNGLRIMADRPDESQQNQIIRSLYGEDGTAKDISETVGF